MISHPAPASPRRRSTGSRSPFLDKVKKRGMATALATFAGSGWLIYEIVHFILVDHYLLPEKLKDITIVTILCAILCGLTWRWFLFEKNPESRGGRGS